MENQKLFDEVENARREVKRVLALQRAETFAMQAEREELERLAQEAQRLVQMRAALEKTVTVQALEASASQGLPVVDPDKAATIIEREINAITQRVQMASTKSKPARLMPGATLQQPDVSTATQVTARIELMDSVLDKSLPGGGTSLSLGSLRPG